ncbi:hypothetical protein GEMRC1_001382 [Eukaryota sp. GEM-RC1]
MLSEYIPFTEKLSYLQLLYLVICSFIARCVVKPSFVDEVAATLEVSNGLSELRDLLISTNDLIASRLRCDSGNVPFIMSNKIRNLNENFEIGPGELSSIEGKRSVETQLMKMLSDLRNIRIEPTRNFDLSAFLPEISTETIDSIDPCSLAGFIGTTHIEISPQDLIFEKFESLDSSEINQIQAHMEAAEHLRPFLKFIQWCRDHRNTFNMTDTIQDALNSYSELGSIFNDAFTAYNHLIRAFSRPFESFSIKIECKTHEFPQELDPNMGISLFSFTRSDSGRMFYDLVKTIVNTHNQFCINNSNSWQLTYSIVMLTISLTCH